MGVTVEITGAVKVTAVMLKAAICITQFPLLKGAVAWRLPAARAPLVSSTMSKNGAVIARAVNPAPAPVKRVEVVPAPTMRLNRPGGG